ncbi:hypothetical protein THAPSDRAFT_264237, partial [Thalassiosira pseudonana CCMP1335]
KRVVFVGGGDSMLLHEVLKYEGLEMVLGLELDQKVTNSFEHFKTQPHFSNPKVQWWFGDGAKSLTLLPRSYFGTFDLVLLDLSETVMSMTVTKGLDVFGAMKLLLSPTGIMVKNDFGYFEKLSKVFDTSQEGGEEDGGDEVAYAGVLMVVEAENVSMKGLKEGEKVAKALEKPLTKLGYEVLSTAVKASDESGGASLAIAMKEGYVLAETWPEAKYVKLDIHLWGAFENQEAIRTEVLKTLG